MMTKITATVPCTSPPTWAVLERQLFSVLDKSVYDFLKKYTEENGEFIWNDDWGGGSPDDFFEPYYNWPLLYLLGGGDHLLDLAKKQWEVVVRHLTRLGTVYNEYAYQEDQFHQSESDIFFYFLCLADPTQVESMERAKRFATFYFEGNPTGNYDSEKKLIRSPRNGSGGPSSYFYKGKPSYGWSPGMAQYGLPYYDLPNINKIEDLKDPKLAQKMGKKMQRCMSKGDVVANLAVTSLVTNAFLLSGMEIYRDWVIDYTDNWFKQANSNNGFLPDNIGLSGKVGEYIDGKWYGGLYGWTWPHGFYNIQMVALVASANAYLLTQDKGYLDLPRIQMDQIIERGENRNLNDLEMSLDSHWIGQYKALGDDCQTWVVPYRYGDKGWFDFQPVSMIFPTKLWSLSMESGDWKRIESLRKKSRYDWTKVFGFHTKEDAGHEEPWLCFLSGDNPTYPEKILAESTGQVFRRLALINEDREVGVKHHVHRWQQTNPITTEALIQLTLGAPQIIYNGGLLMAPLRYFDAERRRPGLPIDVAALVSKVEDNTIGLELVNLSPIEGHTVIIQAGIFGEHQFTYVYFTTKTSTYPGSISNYASPEILSEEQKHQVDGIHLAVELPIASEISLKLGIKRFSNTPSYKGPWGK